MLMGSKAFFPILKGDGNAMTWPGARLAMDGSCPWEEEEVP